MDGFQPIAALLAVMAATLAAGWALARAVALTAEPLPSPPVTGGTPSREHAMSRFHARWYTVTMLFLAFDMEMVFMYPWTRVISAVGASSVIEMFVFLGVLLAGVTYAWREGALRWS
ncbi:NADH-quinone oxidoreductase subunit A [Plantactinospora sp. WMMC1484]|uniref:NADH-quinone oxidoreductase subunit A n=1 Tax=Plantactinospora sp. WMMC1484 TaxID=3404122 RepID=UPI003BF5BDA7